MATARLRDVAEAAGVNPSIASRVLNGDPTVSIRPETRTRINAAAERLGYRPNAFARALKLRRTMTLGLVLPNIVSHVNGEIIRAAERRAAASGYMILVADGDEFARTGALYRRLLLESRVDGLIMASVRTGDEVLAALDERSLPYVLLNRRPDGSGVSVSADDEAGMALGVEHLASAGHRRIAHIAGPQDADTGRRRLAGYRRAVRALGLEQHRSLVVRAPFTERGGFEAMQRLLETAPRPTAVTASSLTAAVGALSAARRAGVDVPADLSIVAFHDAALAEYLIPALTTVRMPLREMAELAVDVLHRRIEGEAAESIVVATRPELVERESVAPPRAH
jgi:LacI family transcriptional regulator